MSVDDATLGSTDDTLGLNLFMPPGHDAIILGGYTETIQPIHGVTPNSTTVQFHIGATENYYIIPSMTRLYCVFRVKKNNDQNIAEYVPAAPGVAATGDDVSVINAIGHALWQNIEVQSQGQVISENNTLYPYRSMIEMLCSFPKEAQDTHVKSSWFYPDGPGQFDYTPHNNEGAKVRMGWITKSQRCETWSPLHVDMFMASRYLPPNVALDLTLTRSPDDFCLLAPAGKAGAYKIVLEKVELYVRKVHVSESIQKRQSDMLKTRPMYFPYTRCVMKTLAVPTGSKQVYWNNVVRSGTLPSQMILCFVSSDAMLGRIDRNPFLFHHYDVSDIQVRLEGRTMQQGAYTGMNWSDKSPNLIRTYAAFFDNLGLHYTPRTVNMTYTMFRGGCSLFPVDFSGELCGSYKHKHDRQNGSVNIDIVFKNDLTEAIVVMAMLLYDSVSTLDASRQIKNDVSAEKKVKSK